MGRDEGFYSENNVHASAGMKFVIHSQHPHPLTLIHTTHIQSSPISSSRFEMFTIHWLDCAPNLNRVCALLIGLFLRGFDHRTTYFFKDALPHLSNTLSSVSMWLSSMSWMTAYIYMSSAPSFFPMKQIVSQIKLSRNQNQRYWRSSYGSINWRLFEKIGLLTLSTLAQFNQSVVTVT